MNQEHPLRAYRRQHDITLDQLGEMVGASKGFLSKIEKRKQIPSMTLAAKLSEATKGAVTLNDFAPATATTEPAQ
jgi:DNA-binding XRE family transcriptional regulator